MDRGHDQNFKNLILDYPRQALAFFAASEAAEIDESVTITPIRQEQLKARLGDRFRELDVPLLVEWPDGRREALLFALEEETDPWRFSIHRLGHYCLDLAELCGTERVVPVVVFLRRSPVHPSSLSLGSEMTFYLQFQYLKCELAALPATDYEQSDNLVARLNLMNMQWSPADKVRLYARAIRGLLDLDNNPRRHAKYLDFIDSYAALTDNERMQYEQHFSEENEAMTGIVSRAREEGMQQGIQQGMSQGEARGTAKGERVILERQIRRRFGELDASTRERLDNATTEELEQWAENIIEASSLEEVFTQH
jgi:hypothetical protein